MADKILWRNGDELNETNLAEAQALQMTSGYVERGLGISPDFVNNNFDVGEGVALPRDGDSAYIVSMDARTDVSLPTTTGMNYVYVEADLGAGSVSLHVDSDDTPPSNPNLKIGEIDASAETFTQLNRGASGEFSTITALDSFIDPAGFEHTSGMATAGHDHTGSAITPDRVHGTIQADAGDVQAAIDTAYSEGGGVVQLDPGQAYSSSGEGGEVHIKKGVIVWAAGVDYEIDQDVNGFFIDNEAKLIGPPFLNCTVGASYTNSAVIFDQGRCADGSYGYGTDSRDPATVEAHIENTGNSGNGVHWRSEDGGVAFTRADVSVRNFSDCLRFDPGDHHINGNHINCTLMGGTNLIRSTGGVCRNNITGVIQCATGGATDRAFWNEDLAGNISFTFIGQVWDSFGCSVSSVEGNDITIFTDHQHAHGVMSNVDSSLQSPRSKVYGMGEMWRYGNCHTGEMWEHNYKWDGWNVHYYDDAMTKAQVMQFDSSGELRVSGPVNGDYTF